MYRVRAPLQFNTLKYETSNKLNNKVTIDNNEYSKSSDILKFIMADHISLDQKKILEQKAQRRAELRNEFLKQQSNPYRHAQGSGGTIVCKNFYYVS